MITTLFFGQGLLAQKNSISSAKGKYGDGPDAISSMPYTPKESMEAHRYFYEGLGNKYGVNMVFVDGFSICHNWYAKVIWQ